jgi:hypothetical protein
MVPPFVASQQRPRAQSFPTVPCWSPAEQLSRQDLSEGHLVGALACLVVAVLQDVGAFQVDRLDVRNRDALQGSLGLQVASSLGSLGVVVPLDSPVVGRLDVAFLDSLAVADGLVVPGEPLLMLGSWAGNEEVAGNGMLLLPCPRQKSQYPDGSALLVTG